MSDIYILPDGCVVFTFSEYIRQMNLNFPAHLKEYDS